MQHSPAPPAPRRRKDPHPGKTGAVRKTQEVAGAPAPAKKAARRPFAPTARRSAAEVVAHPPSGFTARVEEVGPADARRRARLLVLEGEHGFKVVVFTTVRTVVKTVAEGGEVEVERDFDLLPADVLGAAVDISALGEDGVVRLSELLAALEDAQRARPPVHKRPLVQRPFAGLDPAKVLAQAPAPVAKQPTTTPGWSWRDAAMAVAGL